MKPKELLRLIKQLDKSELAKAYSEMNHWKFPSTLSSYEPQFYKMKDCEEKCDLHSKLIRHSSDWIYYTIGTREIFKYHHTVNLKRTHMEFESWWLSNGDRITSEYNSLHARSIVNKIKSFLKFS